MGCAKLSIENLSFWDTLSRDDRHLSQFSPQNVDRLAHIFKLQGVRRDKKEHFITAASSRDKFKRAEAEKLFPEATTSS